MLLTKRSDTQDATVLQFFMQNRQGMYPVHEVRRITNIRRENSVARSMNTLTNEDKEVNKYVDQYGNAPLLKTDETCWNADRSAKVHKWRWNPNYGKPKGVKPGQSMSLFEVEGCAV